MNFKWLHDEVAKLVDPGEPFAIELDIWDHRRGGVEIEVSIWDGHRHFVGPTPEAVLATLRAAYEPQSSADAIPVLMLLPDGVAG